MKSWLEYNGIEIYVTHNERKSVAAERFIRTLKDKMYRLTNKKMDKKDKNVYIEQLDNIVNKYNNTYHSTIKIKPVDVNWNTCIDFDRKNNKEDPKFKVGDRVRILKYENIFAKVYGQNWSEKGFVITKVRDTVPWTYVFSDLKTEEAFGSFYENESQKASQKEFRIEKNN